MLDLSLARVDTIFCFFSYSIERQTVAAKTAAYRPTDRDRKTNEKSQTQAQAEMLNEGEGEVERKREREHTTNESYIPCFRLLLLLLLTAFSFSLVHCMRILLIAAANRRLQNLYINCSSAYHHQQIDLSACPV